MQMIQNLITMLKNDSVSGEKKINLDKLNKLVYLC